MPASQLSFFLESDVLFLLKSGKNLSIVSRKTYVKQREKIIRSSSLDFTSGKVKKGNVCVYTYIYRDKTGEMNIFAYAIRRIYIILV